MGFGKGPREEDTTIYVVTTPALPLLRRSEALPLSFLLFSIKGNQDGRRLEVWPAPPDPFPQ